MSDKPEPQEQGPSTRQTRQQGRASTPEWVPSEDPFAAAKRQQKAKEQADNDSEELEFASDEADSDNNDSEAEEASSEASDEEVREEPQARFTTPTASPSKAANPADQATPHLFSSGTTVPQKKRRSLRQLVAEGLGSLFGTPGEQQEGEQLEEVVVDSEDQDAGTAAPTPVTTRPTVYARPSTSQASTSTTHGTSTPSRTGAKSTPPPPPPPPPTSSTKAVSRTISNMAVATHNATHLALVNRVEAIDVAVDAHKDNTTNLTLTQLELMLEDLQLIGPEITAQHTSCYKNFKTTPDAHGVIPQDLALSEQAALNAAFQEVRTNLTDLVRTLKPVTPAAKPASYSGLKPPKISLPTFLGQHNLWQTFKSSFTALVIKSPAFSDCERLRLLIDALKDGEAKENVSDLEITEQNFAIAWKRMTDRFDSPREIAHSAIRPMLQLPPLLFQSENGIHKLISTVRTTRAQIAQINLKGVPESDVLYTHFVMARLDTRTINEYNQSLKTTDVQTLDSCLTYLERHAKNIGLTKELKINTTASAEDRSILRRSKSWREKRSSRILVATDSEVSDGYSSAGSQRSNGSQRRKTYHKHKDTGKGTKSRSVNFASRSKSPQKTRHGKGKSHQSTKRDSRPTMKKKEYPSTQCAICESLHHRIYNCPTYNDMSIQQRQSWIKTKQLCFNCLGSHTVANCTSKYSCLICHKKHNTTLHMDRKPVVAMINSCQSSVINHLDDQEDNGILPTAVVTLINPERRYKTTARCLLDTGAQSSFITEETVRRLGLHCFGQTRSFIVAGGKSIPSRGSATFNIQTKTHPIRIFQVTAHVLPNITSDLPSHLISKNRWTHLQGLNLADPNLNKPGPIDVLLGAAVYDHVMRSNKITGQPGTPSAYLSDLGYIVMGCHEENNIIAVHTMVNDPEVSFNMEKFWTIEELPTTRPMTEADKYCEHHYKNNTIRLPTGQYQVRWPLIGDPTTLGSSLPCALKRWHDMERKLLKNPALKKDYDEQLEDYIKLNQMEEVPRRELNKKPVYFIPHHAVFKPSSTSTKMRVVFDASAKTSSGLSFNSLLPPGPTIQPELFDQLINFRLKPIAMVADISKMYRQILIHPDERDFARIIWRRKPSDPIKHYRILTIPFGLTTAPFLACRTLRQLGIDEGHKYPLGAKVLQSNMYIDDLMSSQDDIKTAMQVQKELSAMLASAKFELRKWSSNSAELLASIPAHLRETQIPMTIDASATVKTLGLQWHPKTDMFSFIVTLDLQRKHTKRNILSDISKVFDPLGFLAPVIIQAKMLMQKIWTLNVGWDDELPQPLSDEWIQFATTLKSLEKIQIPRCLDYKATYNWELHGFSDASAVGYGAVLYLRGQKDNNVTVKLVASKSRVAPVKYLSIPRMELQAAVLLAHLMDRIKNLWNLDSKILHYWTDSTCVLDWIYASPTKYKIYVANRATQIQDVSNSLQWAYVKSEDNPADCLSRGLSPNELQRHHLWWTGPKWLSQPHYDKPIFKPSAEKSEDNKKEEKVILAITQPRGNYVLQCLSRFPTWKQAVLVMAQILKVFTKKSVDQHITRLASAEYRLVKLIQEEAYPDINDAIRTNFSKKEHRHFRSLQPFKDEQGILRIGGRLHKLQAGGHQVRHPSILPGKHPLVRGLILQTHQSLAHAGKQTINYHLRQQYWIPNACKTIKSVIDKCLICFRYKAQPQIPMMGQLPSARVNFTRPFLKTGVDFAGPYTLKNFTGKSSHFKVWIALFTCFSTRAIHLEVVSNMTQETFLLAFRRFISRRGKPSDMFSDNGTTFVGANNHMEDFIQQREAARKTIQQCLPDMEMDKIQWHFSPPKAPHFGGVWESCVKLVKTHLKKIIEDDIFTFEEFESILLFIESICNSRPLTPMSNDVNDMEVLTPGHFLIGTSLMCNAEHDVSHIKINRLDRYQLVLRRQQDLWKRWQQEYITSLQKINKWRRPQENLKEHDMVLIMDDEAAPLQWKIGRVKTVHPGKDNNVRVVTLEYEGSYKNKKNEVHNNYKNLKRDFDKKEMTRVTKEFIRPVARLAKLPIYDETDSAPEPRRSARQAAKKHVTTSSVNHIVTQAPWSWLFTLITMQSCLSTTTMAHSTETDTLSLSNPLWVSTAIAICALVFAAVGTIGNSITIVAIMNDNKLRLNNLNWHVISLCFSDLLFSMTTLPLTFSKYYYRDWILGLPICKLYVFLLYGNLICSLVNVVSITINRYVKIVYNELYPDLYTNTNTRLIITLTWASSFFVVLLPALELWGKLGPKDDDPASCSIIADDYGYSPKEAIWYFGVCVPSTIIILCYLHVLIFVRHSRAKVNSFHTPHPQVGDCSINNHKPDDQHLTRMICLIVLGYLLCFQPVIILNILDPRQTKYHPYVHMTSSIMAWSTSWLNLAIYVATNPNYRKAYHNLFCKPRTASSTISASMFSVYFTILMLINTCTAQYISNPDLSALVPECETLWSTHQPIPACVSKISWLHILESGAACSRTTVCPKSPGTARQMVTSNGKNCITPSTPCSVWKEMNMDQWECQKYNKSHFPSNQASRLRLPGTMSTYCAVGDFTIKNCPQFNEGFNHVPVILLNNHIFPLAEFHITQDTRKHSLESYTCKGDCSGLDCSAGSRQCLGDPIYCENMGCASNISSDNTIPTAFTSACTCYYNPTSVLHKLTTRNGDVIPDCWGSMYTEVKKQDHNLHSGEYTCGNCIIECTHRGLSINTPGITAKYIKVQKNPGFVSHIPTSSITHMDFTTNMLAAYGRISIDIWIPNYDIPTKREVTCPRSSICNLIECHLCVQRWTNPHCYSYYHWTLLSLSGIVITIFLITVLYISRLIKTVSFWLTWPVRQILKRLLRKRNKPPVSNYDDAEVGIPLMELPPNPYQPTTRGHRRHKNREYLIAMTILIFLISMETAIGCVNFATMSAASTECVDNVNGSRTCAIRMNTRLAVSPLGQSSCFKIQDDHQSHIGTISITTKGIALRCMKELLYYVPRSHVECHSSLQCYSLLSSDECHGDSCQIFPINGSVRAFKHSMNQLGWSSCAALRAPTCFWILTHDCMYGRSTLTNPSQEVYTLFDCPEWSISAELEINIHLGANITTQQMTLYAGASRTFEDIEFQLISASTPTAPILSECIIQQGTKYGIAPCNRRMDLSINKLGSVQCPTILDCQQLSSNCSASFQLIRTIMDTTGLRCFSDITDPAKVIKENALPLKLGTGVLVPSQDTVIYESNNNALMEIQLSTPSTLTITKEADSVQCTASFISLEGCLGCLSGAVLTIEAKTDGGSTMSALECPEVGLFLPIHITSTFQQYHLTAKLNTPEINIKCHIQCAKQIIPLNVKGNLHYLPGTDVRELRNSISFESPNAINQLGWLSFNWVSLLGQNWTTWIYRLLIIIACALFAFITVTTSLKLALKKIV